MIKIKNLKKGQIYP